MPAAPSTRDEPTTCRSSCRTCHACSTHACCRPLPPWYTPRPRPATVHSRPGARRDILEAYVKRLEKLEGIADSIKGVSKSFALQAGREIRIMVEIEKITDEEAVWRSKGSARRVENGIECPGENQMTVKRETRG